MVKKKAGSSKKPRVTSRNRTTASSLTVSFRNAGGFLPKNTKMGKPSVVSRDARTGQFLQHDPQPPQRRDDSVTLSRRDYEALVEAAEDRKALRAYEATRDEEAFPDEIVSAIIDGENPIRIWRKFRGIKQSDLAKGIGVSKSHLSDVENGRSNLSVPVLSALADALEVDMEMLVPRGR